MSARDLSEYAVRDTVAHGRFVDADMALHNALDCDAYPEELKAAARAAERLADEAINLARRLAALAEAGKR